MTPTSQHKPEPAAASESTSSSLPKTDRHRWSPRTDAPTRRTPEGNQMRAGRAIMTRAPLAGAPYNCTHEAVHRHGGGASTRAAEQARSRRPQRRVRPTATGHDQHRGRGSDARARTKAFLDPRAAAHLRSPISRRVASSAIRPRLKIGSELRFCMNSGAASTPTVRPEGACRSRHLCPSSKRHGAVAVLTKQPPRRRRPGRS